MLSLADEGARGERSPATLVRWSVPAPSKKVPSRPFSSARATHSDRLMGRLGNSGDVTEDSVASVPGWVAP